MRNKKSDLPWDMMLLVWGVPLLVVFILMVGSVTYGISDWFKH